MRKDIIVVDIDGTISQIGDRLKFIQQQPKNWDAFYEDCFDDAPIQEICDAVTALHDRGYRIIFCTGRRESCREKTVAWLTKYMPTCDDCTLLMRPNDDIRPDMEVKPQLIDSNLSKVQQQRIAFFVEDRNAMVTKWRELGYICLHVADANF